MRQICMSGSMSEVWKRSQGRTGKAPPDERGGNRYARPTATAPHLDSTRGLVWGDQCQGRSWIIPSPCSTYQRPSPRSDWLCWAAGRSDGQGWPKAIAKRLALDGHEQGGSLVGSGEAEFPNGTSFLRPVFLPQFSVRKHDDRGEFAIWRAPRATNLYSVDPCGSAP